VTDLMEKQDTHPDGQADQLSQAMSMVLSLQWVCVIKVLTIYAINEKLTDGLIQR